MSGTHDIVKRLLRAGAQQLRWSRGTIICGQGDAALHVYYITRGSVSATALSETGRPFIVAHFNDGDFFGQESLIENSQYVCSHFTSAPCEALELSGRKLLEFLKDDKDASEYLTTFLVRRMANVQTQLLEVMFNTNEQRLARLLASLAQRHDNGLGVVSGVTHEMLAEQIGTTRARITSFMNKFRRLKLIDYRGGVVTIYPEFRRVVAGSQVGAEK